MIICYLADAFIQSNLQLFRLSREQSPLEQCGDKAPPQGNQHLILATLGIQPTTFSGSQSCTFSH